MGDALSRAMAHAGAPGDAWFGLLTIFCDGLIALACLSLAGTGAYILVQRRDVQYRYLLALITAAVAGLGLLRLFGLGEPARGGDLANALARLLASSAWVFAAAGLWLLLPRLVQRADARKLDELAGQLMEETADRMMVSERLRRTHEMSRAIIHGSPLAILTMDRQRRITSWNPAAERIYGYTAQELLGKEFPSPPGADLQVVERINFHNLVMAGETLRDIELPRARKDGAVIQIRFHANPLYDAGGEIRGMVVISEDVTEQRKISDAHRHSERLRAQIVQSSEDAIISSSLDNVITSWNPSAERIFGYTAQEAVGAKVFLIYPPGLEAEEESMMERLKSGEDIQHYETTRRHKDGHEILVSLSISAVRDALGQLVGASKIARDITQMRQDQDQARQLQNELAHVARVSAMGQMSAAIAHELNQPLTAVANYVKAAQRLLAADPNEDRLSTARDVMEKAAGQAIRAGGIIRNLRGFVEKRESEKNPEDINEVITTSLSLSFIHSAENGVAVTLDLAEDLPRVEVDRVQIQQVLTNLIRNAVEAMAESEEPHLFLSSAVGEDGFVRLRVRDSGPGLSPEVAARLFQPFTTTKSAGMGVGLAICQSIIEGHDGTIRALREDEALQDGQGACFEIRLPLRQAASFAD